MKTELIDYNTEQNDIRGTSCSNITIDEIIFMRKRKIRIRTHKGDLALLNHLKNFSNKKLYLKSIDSNYCYNFSQYLINDIELQINSAKTYLQKLHALLEDAAYYGYIDYNPMPPIQKLLPKYLAKEKEYLSINEIKKISSVDCRHDITKIAFIFACYTGLRLSDIETIKWEHIHKNGYYQFISKIQVKTNHEVRIPLCRQAAKILSEIKDNDYHSEYIFPMYSRSTIYADLKELERKSKIKKHLTFHVSRVTFATLSIQAGISIFVISKLCGHTDIKTTQIYTKMTDMALKMQ